MRIHELAGSFATPTLQPITYVVQDQHGRTVSSYRPAVGVDMVAWVERQEAQGFTVDMR